MRELRVAVADLRDLANGLHPLILSDGGLSAALDELAARTPGAVNLRATSERHAPDLEAAAWFVACEAVTNAVKHARSSTILIDAYVRDGRLVVSVEDDGIGGADLGGAGLVGIADRANAAGGCLIVVDRPGGGTSVRAELPCAS